MRLDVKKVRFLQLEAGLSTQAALADAAGITRQTVCIALAKGSCSLPTLDKLATALNVKPYELVKED